MASVYTAPPIKNWRTTFERLEKFLDSDLFSSVNLQSQLHTTLHIFTELPHVKVEGRPLFDAVDFSTAKNVSLSEQFGPAFATHWFKLTVPYDVNSSHMFLDFKIDCEAMIYSSEGQPLHSISDEHRYYQLDNGGSCYYIEMACNGRFGVGAKPDRTYSIEGVQIVLRNTVAWRLYQMLDFLYSVAEKLGKDNLSGVKALYTANHAINCLARQGFSEQTLQEALDICQTLFPAKTKSGHDSIPRLTVNAVGHCHIDTAWLWTYDETKRKCARSWANQIHLMEKHPWYTFACSQAQQYEWVEENYPALFERIEEFIKRKQFIPVGGTWVEMDGNVPCLEAMCRQFLFGQRYFKEKFGAYCDVFWLPDTFGYSTCLPQVATLSGMGFFLTQKLSWNLVNKFPHNSFIWQGQDGSSLLSHFPPNDSYCATMKPTELIFAEENYSDKGRSDHVAMLYGFGDGGGGPSEEIITRVELLEKNLLNLPKCIQSSPTQFFELLQQDKANLCTCVGELYFELHQGTFTTQSEIKRLNNRMEMLLTCAEFYSAALDMLMRNQGVHLPALYDARTRLSKSWKLVLCNQFHDVLPGSCIGDAVGDALAYYKEAEDVITLERIEDSTQYYFSLTECRLKSTESTDKIAEIIEDASLVTLKNKYLKAVFDKQGRIVSLVRNGCGIDICGAVPINAFMLYSDMPLFWDAWDIMDYHAETARQVLADSLKIDSNGLEFKYTISEKSSMTLQVKLFEDSPYLACTLKCDWNESRKLLKVEFPFNLHSDKAFYGSQIGYVERTSTLNTTIDTAKHEVCGHKWASVEQFGLGCGLLTPNKYGFRCLHSNLSLSLLRSSKSPDENADMGRHEINYAIMPYKGSFQEALVQKSALEFAERFDRYRVWLPNNLKDVDLTEPLFKTDNALRVISFKMAEENQGQYILRVAEDFGSSVSSCISVSALFGFRDFCLCDVLERPVGEWSTLDPSTKDTYSSIPCAFTPFKLLCFILK